MSSALQQWWSAAGEKRRAAAVLVLLAVAAAAVGFAVTYPGAARLEKARTALAREQERTRQGLLSAAEQTAARERFVAELADYWIPERDGNPETLLASKIEKAAQQAGMKLTAVGEVRSSAVPQADGLSTLDVAVNATDSVEAVARFMAELAKVRPAVRWQKCSLRSDELRNARKLVLSGNLRVLAVQNPAVSGLVEKTK